MVPIFINFFWGGDIPLGFFIEPLINFLIHIPQLINRGPLRVNGFHQTFRRCGFFLFSLLQQKDMMPKETALM